MATDALISIAIPFGAIAVALVIVNWVRLARALRRERAYDQLAELAAQEEAAWQPVTYTLPGQPPVGRVVAERGFGFEDDHPYLRTWMRQQDGSWQLLTSDDDRDVHGDTWRWVEMLDEAVTLELVELSPAELALAALYGPPGARWGDPDTQCPYTDEKGYRCTLGLNHTGTHRDLYGGEQGVTLLDPDLPATGSGVKRGYATLGDDICTCGTPATHQPGCPRYTRVAGPFIPTEPTEPPF